MGTNASARTQFKKRLLAAPDEPVKQKFLQRKILRSKSLIFPIPPRPQRLQLLPQADLPFPCAAPVRPHAVATQQAVFVLEQPRLRHEQNPLLGPAGLGSDGEHLGG